MPRTSETSFMDKVSQALGRQGPLRLVAKPPTVDEAIARLVKRNANLRETFLRAARDAKFSVETSKPSELADKLYQFLRAQSCRRIGISNSPLLERLSLASQLSAQGLKVMNWNSLTLDSSYDLDCGLTDVYGAIAETGSLVIRPDASHGRSLSLMPSVHVAIVEQTNLMADLLDLMQHLSKQKPRPQVTLITGPSKTADIEGSLVTGVHGPAIVQIFFVDEN